MSGSSRSEIALRDRGRATHRRSAASPDADAKILWTIVAGFVCLYLVIATPVALWVAFPNNFDELAHLSYITHVAHFGLPDPAAGSLRLLHPDLAPGFSAEPNYLNHPPAYYLALSLMVPAHGWPTLHTVHMLRLANVGITALAIACAMAVAAVRRIDARSLILYGAMIVLTPVLPYIGGAISNDNLALLGGCICILGAQLLQQDDSHRSGRVALIPGCALAALAKLTAALMTGVFTVSFLLAQWRASGRRPDWRFVAALVGTEVLVCLPYGWLWLADGSPAPLTPGFVTVYGHIAAVGTHLHGWDPRAALSLFGYAGQFLVWLFAGWNPVTAMAGWANLTVLAAPAIVLPLATTAFAANLPWRRGADTVIGSAGVALAAILPLHLLFSYRMYLLTGSPPMDAVPRYYFPLSLIAVPVAVCWILSRLNPPARRVLAYVTLLAMLAALPVISHCAPGGCS